MALLSLAAGSLISPWFTQSTEVRADDRRIFELMIYHANPGPKTMNSFLRKRLGDCTRLDARPAVPELSTSLVALRPSRDEGVAVVLNSGREQSSRSSRLVVEIIANEISGCTAIVGLIWT